MQPSRAVGTGGPGCMGAAEHLREQLLERLAANSAEEAHAVLAKHVHKWSGNRPTIAFAQFVAFLQSLGLPMGGAQEIFSALDRNGSRTMEIKAFCDAMIGIAEKSSSSTARPPQLPMPASTGIRAGSAGNRVGSSGSRSGSAMRSAGSALVGGAGTFGATPIHALPMNGRPPSGMSAASGTSGLGASARGKGGLSGSKQVRIMSAASVRSDSSQRSGRHQPSREAGGSKLWTLPLTDLLIEHFRRALLQTAGPSGLHTFGRSLRRLEGDGAAEVSTQPLTVALSECGVHLEPKDMQLLLVAMDRNRTGSLSFHQFLLEVYGPTDPRRDALIEQAYHVLDRSSDGRNHLDAIRDIYSVRDHPDVVVGALSPDQALNHFVSQFDGLQRDGHLPFDEFVAYYRSVSAFFGEEDDQFSLLLRNSWQLPAEGDGQGASVGKTRMMVNFEDGSERVIVLQHGPRFDPQDGAAVRAQLQAQGIMGAIGYNLGEGM